MHPQKSKLCMRQSSPTDQLLGEEGLSEKKMFLKEHSIHWLNRINEAPMSGGLIALTRGVCVRGGRGGDNLRNALQVMNQPPGTPYLLSQTGNYFTFPRRK